MDVAALSKKPATVPEPVHDTVPGVEYDTVPGVEYDTVPGLMYGSPGAGI